MAAVDHHGGPGADLTDVRDQAVEGVLPQLEVGLGVPLEPQLGERAGRLERLVVRRRPELPAVVGDVPAVRQLQRAEVDVTEEVEDQVVRRQLAELGQELLGEVGADVPQVVVRGLVQLVLGDLRGGRHDADQRGLVLHQHGAVPLLVAGVEPRVEVVPRDAAAEHRDGQRLSPHRGRSPDRTAHQLLCCERRRQGGSA